MISSIRKCSRNTDCSKRIKSICILNSFPCIYLFPRFEYNNIFSWNISGNGSFELLILNCNDSQLDERLAKKYDLSDNKVVTLSFSIDENLNLSYSDNVSKITDVIQSENDLKKEDMDTSVSVRLI